MIEIDYRYRRSPNSWGNLKSRINAKGYILNRHRTWDSLEICVKAVS